MEDLFEEGVKEEFSSKIKAVLIEKRSLEAFTLGWEEKEFVKYFIQTLFKDNFKELNWRVENRDTTFKYIFDNQGFFETDNRPRGHWFQLVHYIDIHSDRIWDSDSDESELEII